MYDGGCAVGRESDARVALLEIQRTVQEIPEDAQLHVVEMYPPPRPVILPLAPTISNMTIFSSLPATVQKRR